MTHRLNSALPRMTLALALALALAGRGALAQQRAGNDSAAIQVRLGPGQTTEIPPFPIYQREGVQFTMPAGYTATGNHTLAYNNQSCTGELTDRALEFNNSSCSNVWTAFENAENPQELTLELPTGATIDNTAIPERQRRRPINVRANDCEFQPVTLRREVNGVVLEHAGRGIPVGSRVFLYGASGPFGEPLRVGDGSRVNVGANVMNALNTLFARIEPPAGTTDRTVCVRRGELREAPAGEAANPRAWCDAILASNPSDYRYCFDARNGGFLAVAAVRPVDVTGPSSVLLPNRGVVVAVQHDPDSTVEATLQGTAGLSLPTWFDARAAGSVHAGSATETTPRATHFQFAPRQPGSANLVITVKKGEAARTHTREFIVEAVYAGALRLGVASVFGGAVDQRFAAQARPGSAQHEVVVTNDGVAEFELVFGASIFLWDILGAAGGRTYVSQVRNYAWRRFMPVPYFGLSLLSRSGGDVSAINAFHMGLEIELAAGFSVAGTFVLRRVHAPISGFSVGAPVPEGAAIERETMGMGLGFVVNFSPEFMRIGSPFTSASGGATQ